MNYRLETFGAEAKSIRLDVGHTQASVKAMVGINEDTLRRLEKGQTMPTIETLDLLSIAYSCDMNVVFSKHKITFDQYFEDRIKKLLSLMRNLDYKAIKKEAKKFDKEFKNSKRLSGDIIKSKMLQYSEYLKSMHNIENAFKDKSRDDITRLVSVLNYNFNNFMSLDENILLDKLEIRICVLLSIIYRCKNEFTSSLAFARVALESLKKRYSEDHDFLYFYFLIVSNTMMIYHRVDDYIALNNLYKDALSVLEDKIGVPTLSSVLLRVGINNHYLEDETSIDFLNVSLKLLKDMGYKDKNERFKTSLLKLYPFCEGKLK